MILGKQCLPLIQEYDILGIIPKRIILTHALELVLLLYAFEDHTCMQRFKARTKIF